MKRRKNLCRERKSLILQTNKGFQSESEGCFLNKESGNTPFFSIVVVSLNAEKLIRPTLDSVLSQTFEDYEVVVKDGISTDETVKQIPSDDRIRVFVQKDTGIYDAMNQATSFTSGRYITYLNCGDTFASPDVLSKARDLIGEENYGYVYGDWTRDGILHKQPEELTDFYLYRTPLCHQSIFFNGDDLRKVFHYNTKYRILADYNLELEMRAVKNTKHIDLTVCSYLGGGVSETKNGYETKCSEREEIIKVHYPKRRRKAYSLFLKMTFPKLRNRLASSDLVYIKKTYQRIVNNINGGERL